MTFFSYFGHTQFGQCASVVDLEVLSTDGLVALLTIGLALGLAPLVGTDIALDNQELANTVKPHIHLSRSGQPAYTASMTASPALQLHI
jgi:hypothetical protein